MATNARSRTKVITFLALTFALSSIFYLRLGSTASITSKGGLYALALMWCPAVAALVTQLVFERTLAGLGWRLPRLPYLALAYLLPVGYGLITYLLVWVSGLGAFAPQQLTATVAPQFGFHPSSPERFAIVYTCIAATLGMVPSLLSALGEEIGWRGLLVPELARLTTFTRTALLSGVVWASWHMPLILTTNYNASTPAWFAIACFTVMVIAFGLVAAWLRLSAGSLWPAVLFHASHQKGTPFKLIEHQYGTGTAGSPRGYPPRGEAPGKPSVLHFYTIPCIFLPCNVPSASNCIRLLLKRSGLPKPAASSQRSSMPSARSAGAIACLMA